MSPSPNQSLLRIEQLGPAEHTSPLSVASPENFVADSKRILVRPHTDAVRNSLTAGEELPSFEVAGPRDRIYFRPDETRAAIATCGGLSPGINDVIRALVMQLWYRYGVRRITGVRYGYHGLGRGNSGELLELTPASVSNIHDQGGSVLGTSRGTPPTAEIVDTLANNNIQMLFTIGGDGTMRGALALSEEIARRGLKTAVVGAVRSAASIWRNKAIGVWSGVVGFWYS